MNIHDYFQDRPHERGVSDYDIKKSPYVMEMHTMAKKTIESANADDSLGRLGIGRGNDRPKSTGAASRRSSIAQLNNLQKERFAQSRMGFSDKAVEIEARIGRIRDRANVEHDEMARRSAPSNTTCYTTLPRYRCSPLLSRDMS